MGVFGLRCSSEFSINYDLIGLEHESRSQISFEQNGDNLHALVESFDFRRNE